MAIWKVKSQTVTVELLGRLPQSDYDKMNGYLQADPPEKTVHDQRMQGNLLPACYWSIPRSTQGALSPFPSLPLSGSYQTWPACWSPWLRLHLRHPER